VAEAEVSYRRERIDRGVKARSDTIFALSSYRELLYLLLPRVFPVAALIALPLVLKGYWGAVLVHVCVYAILALSWDFLASVGLFSLGQALFFGAGAYIAGCLNHYLGWPIYLTLPLGTLGGAFLSTALLAPVVRLRGIYFAMVSLAFPMMAPRVIQALNVAGGTEGLSALALFPSDLGAAYLVVGVLLICLFGFRRIINEDYGIVIIGIRDDDRAVMAGAINIHWFKVQVLFISSLVGAFAGAFMTHYIQFVGLSAFSLEFSILPLASVALGGSGSFAGAVLGSFILVPLSESLRALGGLRTVLYSLILIGSIIGLPEGIFHYIERKYHQLERLVEV
jgi:branched-chain amino acid transport system permease protein